MTSNQSFEVFYDGGCPLCKREISMIRRQDKDGRLLLTDIAAESFVAQDRSVEQLMREIHGRYGDGRYATGVEVFREIYRRLGWGWLVWISELPGLRQLLDWCYRGFAYFRYRHAMQRMKRLGRDCSRCRVQPETSTKGR